MNRAQALNFTRSARAPLMSAGVRIANIIWKTTKTKSGMVVPSHSSVRPMSLRPTQSLFQPMMLPESVPKAREKPYSTHRTVTIPRLMKLIISMLRVLLTRTMPP
ncbi:hypothetical protein GCM10020256_20200 [Streptomyces thermocoprophilus]